MIVTITAGLYTGNTGQVVTTYPSGDADIAITCRGYDGKDHQVVAYVYRTQYTHRQHNAWHDVWPFTEDMSTYGLTRERALS